MLELPLSRPSCWRSPERDEEIPKLSGACAAIQVLPGWCLFSLTAFPAKSWALPVYPRSSSTRTTLQKREASCWQDPSPKRKWVLKPLGGPWHNLGVVRAWHRELRDAAGSRRSPWTPLELLGGVPSLLYPFLAVWEGCFFLLFHTSLHPVPTVPF